MGGRGSGFASMSTRKHRELSSEGGTVAHSTGAAYEWDSRQAKRAGKKGGLKTQQQRKQQVTRKQTKQRKTR